MGSASIMLFNNFLFFISTVFGLNTPITSQKTSLEIDLSTKIVTIDYYDLVIPSNTDEYQKEEAIKELKLAKGLEERYRSFKLLSKKFSNEAGQINAHITFKYDNEEDLFYVLKFEKAEDNLIHYRLFKDEILESSNDTNKTNDLKRNLIWDRETTLIKMTISENGNYKKANEGVSSISNYW